MVCNRDFGAKILEFGVTATEIVADRTCNFLQHCVSGWIFACNLHLDVWRIG